MIKTSPREQIPQRGRQERDPIGEMMQSPVEARARLLVIVYVFTPGIQGKPEGAGVSPRADDGIHRRR